MFSNFKSKTCNN